MNCTQRTYIAIDPGAGGGVAWSNRLGVFVQPMPDTRRGHIDLFQKILEDADNPVAYIEKVVPFIPGGGASSMFTYGANVERPGCVLETLGVRLIELPPKQWQKDLNLGGSNRIAGPRMPKGLNKQQKKDWTTANFDEIERVARHNDIAKRDWKRKLQAEAERRYPELRVTLKNCDALLLLDAVILREGGQLQLT